MSGRPCKLRVAICGGGVGGLTTAFALSRSSDIHVDVYEAAPTFAEMGAGIGVWWRTRGVLKTLGLEDDLIRLLGIQPSEDRVPSIEYRISDQSEGLSMGSIYSRGGVLGVHRAEFHEALLNRLTSSRCRTFTSKRLHGYKESRDNSRIQLTFQDGSTATCDILIGADGLNSAVRAGMVQAAASIAEEDGRLADAAELRNLIEPRFSGVLCYRALVPAEKLWQVSPEHRALSSPVQYLGKDRHFIAYPISRGRFINFAAFDVHPDKEGTRFTDAWVVGVDPEHVIRLYDGWEKEANELVQCLDGLKVTRWAVNVVQPLPSFAFGNVAVLGDAAHAMTPFQGAGAGQAIEDASVLSTLLSHRLTTKQNAAHVLGIYSRVRQPLATEVSKRSRLNGEHFALHGLESDVSPTRLREISLEIQENFEWVSETDATADLQRAMELLERGMSSERN
ncbi:salicylate hydroxylase [Gloeopeniophorella convolvens]|nr:salicylate hydroxylase [Gloeopeniophorella convolvens]